MEESTINSPSPQSLVSNTVENTDVTESTTQGEEYAPKFSRYTHFLSG